jgi:hypothetical protein
LLTVWFLKSGGEHLEWPARSPAAPFLAFFVAANSSAIRFFFSHENTSDDVARVLEVSPAIVEKVREVSGFAADQSGEVRLGAAFS